MPQAAQGDEAAEAQHGDVRVADGPVVEVRHLLQGRQGLQRPLDAGDQVPDGAGQHEAAGRMTQQRPAAAARRQPQVGQHREDRNDHRHGIDDGDRLQPVGNRRLQDVVAADVRVEHHQRPEADQRQRVGVERGVRDARDHVEGGADGQRRQDQAHQVVAVEPQEDRVQQAAFRARGGMPHHVADRVGPGGPEQRADEVPDGDVERVSAGADGHDQVDGASRGPPARSPDPTIQMYSAYSRPWL